MKRECEKFTEESDDIRIVNEVDRRNGEGKVVSEVEWVGEPFEVKDEYKFYRTAKVNGYANQP